MSNSYVIQWKSSINGRAGRGTNRFSLEEAENLAEELNREYPEIHHEVAEIGGSPSGSETSPPGSEFNLEPGHAADAPAAGEEPPIVHNPDGVLAFR
jgi:hypothetical protein